MRNRRRTSASVERRRRLVHDQDAGVLRERLGDLDPLAVADREGADEPRDVEVVDVERGEQLPRLGVHRRPVEGAEAGARRVAHEDVLGDAQRREQQQLLEDRGDAGGLGIVRAREADLLAVQAHGPGIRLVEAGDDLDQGRLAGAVLAEQRVHLTGAHVETDIIQRFDARGTTC